MTVNGIKGARKWINDQIKVKKVTDPRLKWFFDLEFSNTGEKYEHELFTELNNLRKTLVQDMVILHSCTFYTNPTSNNSKYQEIDFLIFSPSRRLIITIEVKKRLEHDKVFAQLEKYFNIFEERFGTELDSWTFLPVIYVGESVKFEIKTNATSIVTPAIKFNEWMKRLLQNYDEHSNLLSESKDGLKRVLEVLIFAIHVSKTPLTTSEWDSFIDKAIESVYTQQNIIFYSKNQLPVLSSTHSDDFKRLHIKGVFGSGKTVLLQEKAEQMARKSYKVYYIMDGDKVYPFKKLLESSFEKKWRKCTNINVISSYNKLEMVRVLLGFCSSFSEKVILILPTVL